jgi:hypothetical protein
MMQPLRPSVHPHSSIVDMDDFRCTRFGEVLDGAPASYSVMVGNVVHTRPDS